MKKEPAVTILISRYNVLAAKIAELEKEKAEYLPVLAWIARECTQVDGGMMYRFKSYLEIRGLEQQAKGCTDGAKACSISFGEGVVIGETELDGYAKDLLRQAKALKEGK
jgi:hypothetical protein